MVEQLTLNQLVIGSSPIRGTKFMAWIYILRGNSGKYYIGSTDNLARRLNQHNNGHTPSTVKLGLPVELIVSKEISSLSEARILEKNLKKWKSCKKVIEWINQSSSTSSSPESCRGWL